jgi:hypothetical protein
MPHDLSTAPRTPWFASTVEPTRIGVYEVRYWSQAYERHCSVERRRWTGARWVFPDGTARSGFGDYPQDQWRGLAEVPLKS